MQLDRTGLGAKLWLAGGNFSKPFFPGWLRTRAALRESVKDVPCTSHACLKTSYEDCVTQKRTSARGESRRRENLPHAVKLAYVTVDVFAALYLRSSLR